MQNENQQRKNKSNERYKRLCIKLQSFETSNNYQ